MSYASASDVTNSYNSVLLSQLTTDTGEAIADSVIDNEATEQSNFMDSYFSGRYVTPITGPASVLNILKPHCTRLVLAGLFQRRLMLENYTSLKDDKATTIEWLKSIRDGDASLSGAETVEIEDNDTSITDLGGSEDAIFIGNAGYL